MDHISVTFKNFNTGVLETSICVLGYSREGISKLHRRKGQKKFRLFGCLISQGMKVYECMQDTMLKVFEVAN